MSEPVCLKGKCEGPSWWGCGSVRGCYERAKEGYAEVMVKRDQLARLEGSSTQRRGDSGGETSTDGRTLFPGS